jgi:hypothetical protein
MPAEPLHSVRPYLHTEAVVSALPVRTVALAAAAGRRRSDARRCQMASADRFAVRPDALTAGVGTVGSAVHRVEALAASLVGVGGQLVDAVGLPGAADAALDFTVRWVAELRRLEALVDGLGVGLALAGELYVRGDTGVADAFEGGPGP